MSQRPLESDRPLRVTRCAQECATVNAQTGGPARGGDAGAKPQRLCGTRRPLCCAQSKWTDKEGPPLCAPPRRKPWRQENCGPGGLGEKRPEPQQRGRPRLPRRRGQQPREHPPAAQACASPTGLLAGAGWRRVPGPLRRTCLSLRDPKASSGGARTSALVGVVGGRHRQQVPPEGVGSRVAWGGVVALGLAPRPAREQLVSPLATVLDVYQGPE